MKYIKPGKRQLILAALVFALGSAIYLNWKFAPQNNLITENMATSTKELGQAQFVNSNMDTQSDEQNDENKQNQKDQADCSLNKIKIERQKARDEATDTIKDIIENVNSSQENKAEAIKFSAQIAQRIEDEANIEGLIKAKGFKNCLAFIKNDECSIIVSGQPLTETLATQIKDIACSQGNISIEKIKIIENK